MRLHWHKLSGLVCITAAIVLLGGVVSLASAQAKAADAPKAPAANAEEQAKAAKFSADWMDARLEKLHRKLHITQAQEAAWNDYAQAMRESSKAMEPLYNRYYTEQATMTAVENMKLFMAMSEERAKSQRQLIPLFEKLYTMMSDQQKQTADELYSDQERPKPRKKK